MNGEATAQRSTERVHVVWIFAEFTRPIWAELPIWQSRYALWAWVGVMPNH